MPERENKKSAEKGIGCSTVIVLTAGVMLALIGAAAGGGCTARIPATSWNVSTGISFGDKHDMRTALPEYLQDKEGSHDNFINTSESGNIGPFGEIGIFVVGEQPNAPIFGINIDFDH